MTKAGYGRQEGGKLAVVLVADVVGASFVVNVRRNPVVCRNVVVVG